MCQNNFPHVYIFIIKGVIEFNALQLIGSLLSFLNETISLSDVTDIIGEIIKFLFPDGLIFEIDTFTILKIGC